MVDIEGKPLEEVDVSTIMLETIVARVKALGINEAKCLSDLGIANSFFSTWKSGRAKNPSFEKIYYISKYLNLSMDTLTVRASVDGGVTEDEVELLHRYRSCGAEGKEIIRAQALLEMRRIQDGVKE